MYLNYTTHFLNYTYCRPGYFTQEMFGNWFNIEMTELVGANSLVVKCTNIALRCSWRPEFHSRLKVLCLSFPPLSAPHLFLSPLHCPIKLRWKPLKKYKIIKKWLNLTSLQVMNNEDIWNVHLIYSIIQL